MKRLPARSLAAGLATLMIVSAACAPARAAEPFTELPLPAPVHQPHKLAYAALIGGAGLIGASFAFGHEADTRYHEYLDATDPDRISDLYDRTIRLDHLSSASLLTGEGLIVAGIYLRFLRTPAPQRVSLVLGAGGCALSLSF